MPTWLTVSISVITTVAGFKVWGPLGRWIGRRLDLERQWRGAERSDTVSRLTADLKEAREENVELRHELAEERELRMTFAQDYAVLKERVEGLTKTMAEDKRDCQREIRRLNAEIRRLNTEVSDMRRAHRQQP